MFVLAMQIFLGGKKHLVANWLISTLKKVINFIETISPGSSKPLLATENRLQIS
jgi:hypothetical protein